MMKKTLFLFFAFIASVGAAWADKTVYLNPTGFSDNGNWTASNARFFASSNTGDNPGDDKKEFTAVAGSDLYKVDIPDSWTTLRIFRRNPDDNETWNRINAAQESEIVNNAIFTVTGWDTYSFTTLSSTTKTIYLDGSTWDDPGANENFAVYAYSNNVGHQWYKMTLAGGTYYKTDVPDSWTAIILVRCDGSKDVYTDGWGAKWTQTNDIAFNGISNNSLFKIGTWNGDSGNSAYTSYAGTGSLDAYTVKLVTNTWETPKVYAYGDNSFEFFGSWSGTAMNSDGTVTINGESYKKWTLTSAQHPVLPTGLIFTYGDANILGTNKTIDLPFVNNRTYYFGVLGGSVDVDTNVAADAIAFIGTNNVSNILNGTGAQPNSYDNEGKMNIVVDLGLTKTIDAFNITLSGDRWVTQFDLSYSTDGSSWTKINTYQTGITSNTTTTISQVLASPVTAKYIKYTSSKTYKKGVVTDQFPTPTSDPYSETIKNFQLIQYAPDALNITSLTAEPSLVGKGEATEITFTAKNSQGKDLSTYGSRVTVTYAITAGTGTLEGTTLTVTGESVEITATASNASTASTTATTTVKVVSEAIPEAKQGTTPENDVIFYNSTTSGTWSGGDGTIIDNDVTIFGSKAKVVLLGAHSNVSISVTTNSKMKDNNRASVAIYPASSFNGAVVVDPGNKYENFSSLTPNAWNVFDFGFTDGSDDAVTTFKVNNDSDSPVEVLIANAVVYYKDPNAFEIITTDGVATVTGNVTAANVADINAADAIVIDLTGVNAITGDINLTPTNPNALVKVAGTSNHPNAATADSKYTTLTAKNMVVRSGDWIYPCDKLDFEDANGNKWWYGEGANVQFISTGNVGYKITRRIPANSYVTAAPMADVTTVPTGIDVYEFTDYTEGTVTFTKKANRAMSAKTPYVLHNTTESPIDLEVSGIDDMNRNTGAQTVNKNSANFVANLIEITTSSSDNPAKYVLVGSEFKKGEGVKIGAFRAYFTGVQPSATGNAIAIFNDDETTKIATINAEGEIHDAVVYDLNGRRVENPTKGVYIVNGKKVVIK